MKLWIPSQHQVKPVWWLMSVIPALKRYRQEEHMFKVLLCYIVSSGPAWTK